MAMTDGLDEDVVDFVPNYDNQLTQPEVLPAAIPNLLVNGASGIAVGMATNMAPHNLIEVAAAARHLLENPDAGLDDLMAYVPGPDLPTGGTIVGLDGIRDAYATGRGSFKTRAKVTIEQLSARRTGLVVTELPYLVGPEKVIEKIKDGVNAKRITGIADVTDLTDRKNGLRLVIGIKTGFSPEAVLEQLYRLTPLEDGFSINNVALVGGTPQTLGLKELLRVFLDHRVLVVTRRSQFRLARRLERLHLVEGLLVAILDIDEVIQVIRTSDDTAQARQRLMEVFDLSQLQADYILELQLRRLTRFSRIELETERDRLRAEIAELEALLADPAGCAPRSPRSWMTWPSGSEPRVGPSSPARRPAARSPRRPRSAARPRRSRSPTYRRSSCCPRPAAPCGSTCRMVRNRPHGRLAAAATTPCARRSPRPPAASSGPSPRKAGSSASPRSTCPRCPPTPSSWPPARGSPTTSGSRTRRNACSDWRRWIPSCRSRWARDRAS